MLVLYMIANCRSFVFLHTLMQVSTREANIVCIAQTTFEIINNVLLIHNGRFMFLWFDFALNLPTCVNRMDISIDLSAEIIELVSYRVRRFLAERSMLMSILFTQVGRLRAKSNQRNINLPL